MDISGLYIVLSVFVLLVIVLLVFFTGNEKNRLTTLASLAFAFVLAGIIFGENRAIGYSLMGIGMVFALIDIFRRSENGKPGSGD
jgi:uncharacterized membrane protein